ncbi:hypothetical protein MKX01_042705 [Papaver californicum]|nr:hypothetical protein MKX01_042705 [Papaver californicum]
MAAKLYRFLDKTPANLDEDFLAFLQSELVQISPRKNLKKKFTDKTPFVIPEDGHYCSSVYTPQFEHESGQSSNQAIFQVQDDNVVLERKAQRKFKRVRERKSLTTAQDNQCFQEQMDNEEEVMQNVGFQSTMSFHERAN